MTTSAQANLYKLSDSPLTVADPAEDIRGRQIVDSAGNEVGKIDDLMIDDRQGKVRFLLAGSGGFLGIGETKFLIPVDAVTRITGDTVYINQTREHVAGAPRYDPELADMSYWDSLYGYYGYALYWAPGYIYPAYPRYPVLI